jgi:hypothetical protein
MLLCIEICQGIYRKPCPEGNLLRVVNGVYC